MAGDAQRPTAAVVAGALVLAAAGGLLWWNERRAVAQHRYRAEGPEAAITVPADAPSSAEDGKLVHVIGAASTGDTLADTDFGVHTEALVLRRSVEFMQWVEQRHGEGHRYRKTWVELPVDSSQFQKSGHDNPPAPDYRSAMIYAQSARLEGFELSAEIIQRMEHFVPLELPLNPEAAGKLRAQKARAKYPVLEPAQEDPPKAKVKGKRRKAKRRAKSKLKGKSKRRRRKAKRARKGRRRSKAEPVPEAVEPPAPPEAQVDAPSAEQPQERAPDEELLLEDWGARGFTIYDGQAVKGEGTPRRPEVGDVRVTYAAIVPGRVSVVARQAEGRLVPHEAPSGDVIGLVATGVATAEEMFAQGEEPPPDYVWLLRILGFGIMVAGMGLLRVRTKVFAAGAAGCAVLALAWIFFSPLVGGILLLAGGASMVFVRRRSNTPRA